MAGKKKPEQSKTNIELIDDKSDVKGRLDGRGRITFKVQVNPKSSLDAVLEHESLQVGNKQSALQTLLNRGLHPKEEPVLESAEVVFEGLNTMDVLFTYSAKCVPSTLDGAPQGTELPVDREDDKRERVRLSRLRAAAHPDGFVDAE